MGPSGLFLVLGQGCTTVLGSTDVVEQLSFSMFPSILSFDFDSIWHTFLTFLGPYLVTFWGFGRVHQLFWGLFIYLNNFHFLLPSILTFGFDFIWGNFLLFGTLMG